MRVTRDWWLVLGVAVTTSWTRSWAALALAMLWRRSRPLAMLDSGFGALMVLDLAWALVAGEPFPAYAGFLVVVLVYALLRWGTSRQAAAGSVIVLLVWPGW